MCSISRRCSKRAIALKFDPTRRRRRDRVELGVIIFFRFFLLLRFEQVILDFCQVLVLIILQAACKTESVCPTKSVEIGSMIMSGWIPLPSYRFPFG